MEMRISGTFGGGDLLQKKIAGLAICSVRILTVSTNGILKASSGLLRLI